MTTLREEIVIDAPIDDVFAYMATPENHTAISPSLIDIRNVQDLPNGGHEADFTFQLLGRDLDAHSRDIEFAPSYRRVYEFEGDVDGRISYDFESENGSTRFTYMNEFEPPGPKVLGGMTGSLMKRYLIRDTKSMLNNAKMIIEAERTEMVVDA